MLNLEGGRLSDVKEGLALQVMQLDFFTHCWPPFGVRAAAADGAVRPTVLRATRERCASPVPGVGPTEVCSGGEQTGRTERAGSRGVFGASASPFQLEEPAGLLWAQTSPPPSAGVAVTAADRPREPTAWLPAALSSRP